MTTEFVTYEAYLGFKEWIRTATDEELTEFISAFSKEELKETTGLNYELLLTYKMALTELDPANWVYRWYLHRGAIITAKADDEVTKLVKETIAAQPQAWKDWTSGKEAAIGRLLGDLRKRGLDPKIAKAALEECKAKEPK